jgi:lipoate-protein ligase A
MVVVGRSSRVAQEVNVAACEAAGIPILRRASGGAAIVAGPGCLMYGVVLRYQDRDHLRMLDEAHRHVLGIVAQAVGTLLPGVEHCGTSDLAIAGRKFSGNSLRCKRDHFLYHGTLLYDFELTLVEQLLQTPPRQPEYRDGRGHGAFVRNLGVPRTAIKTALITAFDAHLELSAIPHAKTDELRASRYERTEWNRQR